MTDENLSGATDALENLNQELPVVEVKNQDTETPDVVEEEGQEIKDSGEQVKKKPSGWQRKIAKLEAENAELRARTTPPATALLENKEPALENYQTWEDYNSALIEYKAEQTVKKILEQKDNQVKEAELVKTWKQKVEAAKVELPDYDEVVSELIDMPRRQEIDDILTDSPVGAKLAYHLAQNPELLDSLNQSSSFTIFKTLAQLETQFGGGKEKAVVKVSQSPPPITPVRKGATNSKSLAEMSTDEFIAARNQKK